MLHPYHMQHADCFGRVFNDEFQGVEPAAMNKYVAVDEEAIGALVPAVRGARLAIFER